MRLWWVFCFLAVCFGCAGSESPAADGDGAREYEGPNAIQVDTTKGSFTIELFPVRSPRATAVVLESARSGVYSGRTFYGKVTGPRGRNLHEYIPLTWKRSDPTYKDFVTSYRFTRGTVGMILKRQAPGSTFMNFRGSFFVCTRTDPRFNFLGALSTAVGQVIDGMDVVDRLAKGDRVLSVTPLRVQPRYDKSLEPLLAPEAGEP